jgi:hypothetical protein
MSQSEMIARVLLLLLPALVAGLGGFLAVRRRRTKYVARTIQSVAACTLLGSSIAAYFCGLPPLFWVLQVFLALPCCVEVAVGLTFVKKLNTTLVAPRRWDLALLAIAPVLLACALWQLDDMAAPVIAEFNEKLPLPRSTREAPDIAYTDRGRHIRLFDLQFEENESFALTGDDGLKVSGTPVPFRSIRLTEPDGASNCVGWVFTGAHHLMQCVDVDTILEDNGYQAVKQPQVGDLIIYRDPEKVITHAGRVALLLNGEQPLIESKWGYQGVFMHLPEGSPFGTQWTYYRTHRPNHHLLLTSPPLAEASGRTALETPP